LPDRTKKMLKDIVRSAPEVVKRRVVPPDAIAEWKERIEEMQDDIDAIGEEEKVEKELRVADMEAEKATNMMQHRDEIMNRPKKTWFQTNQEKRETREKNIASSRRIEKDPNINPETGEKMITKKKIINEHSKKDKYAGLSRKKRRNAMFREEEEMDRKEMEKERQAAEMFEVMSPFSLPAADSMERKFPDLLMLLFLRRARGRGRSQQRSLCRRRR
jgi:ATP-dependent RNA helicase DDX27